MNTLRAIWWKIYPNDDRHRWMAVLWLPFMIWFFLDPFWKHSGPLLWIGNTVYGLVFVWLYLYSFSHREPLRSYAIVAMFVMTAALVPFHNGAVSCLMVFAVAAGAFTPSLWRALFLSGSIWSCWGSTPTICNCLSVFGARC